ncbi:MAG TPA: hypothetical protein VF328_10560 [Mycobacterium sp.]
MNTSTRFITVVMAALGMTGISTGSAAAEAANGAMVPLSALFRSCDFSKLSFVAAAGFGSGQASISTSSNTVTADVRFAIGTPNTPYNVRLIQGPRPGTQTCNTGDPGVASAVLNTDGNGTGAVTLHDAVRSGANNAWVFIEGPPDPGQIRGEFYTSEIPTSLG